MPTVCIGPGKPMMLSHRNDLGVGVGIANQRQARERVSSGRQSMTLVPNDAVNEDGFASSGQAAELASRAGER